MQALQHLITGKRKYAVGILLLLFTAMIGLAFSMGRDDDFDVARREILLRRIGHEILLQSGDSVSLILPVQKIAENEYQVSFENELSFHPDSLVNTTQRLLAKDPLTNDYVVTVHNNNEASVAYGFAIAQNKKNDIIACIGRKQPKAHYTINIRFKPLGIITAQNSVIMGGLTVLAFIGFIFFKPMKPRQTLPGSMHTGMFTLGQMLFDGETRKLMLNGKTIDLTRTEARVLRMFALAPNQAIERGRLQKEIWEDECVIAGRSLDMFISKLRKKLEDDPTLKIVVIRGKGYKLSISE